MTFSQSRLSGPVAVRGGTGSAIRTSISASVLDRSSLDSARLQANSSQMNGRASTNVTSSPADTASSAMTVPKVKAATGSADST